MHARIEEYDKLQLKEDYNEKFLFEKVFLRIDSTIRIAS